MDEIVRSKLAALEDLDDEALGGLPAYSETIAKYAGKDVLVGVHNVAMADGSRKIVVQAIQDRWFGLSTRIVVAGLVLGAKGGRRRAADSELWDFS
jgi:hypothetical protein